MSLPLAPRTRWNERPLWVGIFVSVCAVAATAATGMTTQATRLASASGFPTAPPAQICGNAALLAGPSVPPAGAVTIPSGDNSSWATSYALAPSTTYWFAPGTHTLGSDQYSQLVPHDNDVFLGAPGAIIDGQNVNNYAFTQQAIGVTIKYLTVQHFGSAPVGGSGGNVNAGVINQGSASNWTIQYNTVTNNHGAGVFYGSNNVISYNCLSNNGQYGLSGFRTAVAWGAGPSAINNVVIDHNEIGGNNTDDWEHRISGCGCSGGAKFWDTRAARLTKNWVHDNKNVGLWADTNNIDFTFDGNYINNNDNEGIMYEISYNAKITHNTLIRNALVGGPTNPFPTGAIYLSEAGGDARVSTNNSTLDVSNNNMQDNWSGVVIWENSNRFCGIPGYDTPTSYCTKVNANANHTTCVSGTINNAPYYSDCRWKSQNISVHDNLFSINPASIAGCTPSTSCGLQGLFSEWGSWPSWSPYKKGVISSAITFNQNNHFRHNTYSGQWGFMAFDMTHVLGRAAWQAAPYNQDAGSTFDGGPPPTPTPPTITPTPTPTATPPPTRDNSLDGATATLERSLGQWSPWFSSSIARVKTEAQRGTASLHVSVTAPYGWGVTLNNYPGFTAGPGNKTISFWGKKGSGSGLGATLTVEWKDSSGSTLQTDHISLPSSSATWQEASGNVVAPIGTSRVFVTLSGSAGVVGDDLYFDSFYVGDGGSGIPAYEGNHA